MTERWVDVLAGAAPDVVGAWRGIEVGRFISVRREVRRRAGRGSTEAIVGQLAAVAEALGAVVGRLPEDAFDLLGGEADWTVAEAIGHAASARSGLVLAASLAASGRWPANVPRVVPSVPGPSGLRRAELLAKLQRSQRIVERASGAIAGHETDPCPLEHPLVGRLRCGEWLLFAGVHDVMHLEQLHGIEASVARASDATDPRPESRPPVG